MFDQRKLPTAGGAAPREEEEVPSPSGLPPTVGFVALLLLGVLLDVLPFVVKPWLSTRLDWGPPIHVLEDLASAIIVAALIGISYERFMHARLKREFEAELGEQRKSIENLVTSVRSTDARGVFALLRDIAEHQDGMPTLYRPARDESKEFVLATSTAFFEHLILSENSREQVVKALGDWCAPGSPLGLRFLGSDFIGLLRLRELESYLRDQYNQRCADWNELEPLERDCLLNYLWSYSRCEVPMYKDLKRVLLETPDDYIQRWILWVPRQMNDPHLPDLVDAFLEQQGKRASTEAIKDAIRALGALFRHGAHVEPIVSKHASLFAACNLTDMVQREIAWSRGVPRTHHAHADAPNPLAAGAPPAGRVPPESPQPLFTTSAEIRQPLPAEPPVILRLQPAEPAAAPRPLPAPEPPPVEGERA